MNHIQKGDNKDKKKLFQENKLQVLGPQDKYKPIT